MDKTVLASGVAFTVLAMSNIFDYPFLMDFRASPFAEGVILGFGFALMLCSYSMENPIDPFGLYKRRRVEK